MCEALNCEELRFEVEDRDECPITEPRYLYDHIPSWFIEAMRKLSPTSHWWKAELPGGASEEAMMVFQDLEFSDGRWFDHAGWDEHDRLISEPYALRSAEIAELENVCARMGAAYRISGQAYHYPTMTVRIEIYPTTIN
jgi:hypothetical protein